MRVSVLIVLCLLIVGLLVAACGGDQGAVEEVATQVVEGEATAVVEEEGGAPEATAPAEPGVKRLVMNFGAGDVPTIDPALSTDTSSTQIVELAFIGLTHLNEETAEVEPGMATDWTVSEDGTTYTYNLRTDVPWTTYNTSTGEVEVVTDEEGNERMVTCEDFRYGILRTLDPATAADYAYVLYPIVGAQEFNTADNESLSEDEMTALREGVGVTCEDEATLTIQIQEPLSSWPAISGMWIARAQPQWVIEEQGDRWTEVGSYHTYGPYALKEWNHEVDITMIANPHWPGADNIPQAKITEVTFLMLDQTPAFANYETGQLDVVNPPLTELDRVRADPDLSQQLHVSPILCTYYYGFNVTKAPFDDPNVRKAFSWAIDRTAIVENVTKGGQEPARWMSRPGVAAAPDPEADDLGPPVTADPEAAQEFLAASSYGSAENLPPIQLVVNQVEGHVRIAEAVQQMWAENLGVQVQVTTQEWNVFLQTLDEDPPQIFRDGWCADYPDAVSFTRDVFRSGTGNNHTLFANEEFDRLVDQAAAESDDAARADLIMQAERILVEEEAAIIPVYWYTGVSLTRPYVQRTYSVLGGQEAIYKWDINRPEQ